MCSQYLSRGLSARAEHRFYLVDHTFISFQRPFVLSSMIQVGDAKVSQQGGVLLYGKVVAALGDLILSLGLPAPQRDTRTSCESLRRTTADVRLTPLSLA